MTDCDHTDGGDLIEPEEANNPWSAVFEGQSGPAKSGFTCTYECAKCGEAVVWEYRPTRIDTTDGEEIWSTEYGPEQD